MTAEIVNLFGEPDETSPLNPQFERFWRSYPRHIGKGAALAQFEKALRRTTFEKLMSAVERFREAPESVPGKPDSIPHARTWLYQERWNDEPTIDQAIARHPAAGARIPASKPEYGPDWTESPEDALARVRAIRELINGK